MAVDRFPEVVAGTNERGNVVNVPVTSEGHLEVDIHGPINPFYSVHTEVLTPIFQTDGVTGIKSSEIVSTTGRAIAGATSATITNPNNQITCSTGTTSYSFAVAQSRARLRYRPGQGVVGRFTALYSAPVADSYLLAGFGTAETGLYFGYNGTTFGIQYTTGGVRRIQTLTVTVGAGGAENVTITLNGIATVVAVTAATAQQTAYQLSRATYPGWEAFQEASTVVFVADSAGPLNTGAYSIASTGVTAGAFATTLAGVTSTDTFIPQSTWNGDKMDGTGDSGITLDKTKGNVFQINIQYLGYGSITFQIETCSTNGNNSTLTTVHTIKFPNTRTTPTLSQPSFPFSLIAYSAGSTTNISVTTASYAGFIEGTRSFTGPRMTYFRETNGYVGSVAATYYPLFTIRNNLVFPSKASQTVINLLSLGCAHDDATPITIYLIRNATLAGTPNFPTAFYSTNSCTKVDTGATTCSFTDNEQVIFSLPIGQNSGQTFSFTDSIVLQPGETVTLAARAVTGTATYVNVSLNTREDH